MSGAAAIGAANTRQSGAVPPPAKTSAQARSPDARLPGYNPDRNAYFGDLHVHTYLSNDAYISNVRRTPDDAPRGAAPDTCWERNK